MAGKKSPKLYKRKWLNTHGSAYVIIDAELETIDYGKRKGGTELGASLDIKDCTRQISLEFYAFNEKDYKARLKKIRALIESIEELEAFMKANPPTKPLEPLPELLLTEKVAEDPAPSDDLVEALMKPSVIDVGSVTMTPVRLRRLVNENSGR